MQRNRTRPGIVRGALLAALTCCFANMILGQTTGSVQGTVTDPQGASVPGVILELTNTGTNISSTQTAGQSGAYFFNSIQPGTYALKASMQGFKTDVINNVIIDVNKAITLDVHLSVGTLTQTMSVSADSLQVEVASAQVSTDVSQKFVNELPLFTRNAMDLVQLAPGVVLTHQIEGGSQLMNILTDQVDVNGATTEQNNFYLDGIDNQAPYHNGPLQMPNPDAIQELSASTSNTSAEYGRQVGGVFNFITKSGTNQFHGDAYYYFRNSALDANTFENNLSGVAKPTDYWKEVGGTVGGPIIKNKTFFFLSFLRYSNNSQGILNTHQGITQQMLNGDFSQLLSGPNPVQLMNPDTGAPLFNNQIPTSLIDPVGHKFMSLIPTVSAFGLP